MFDRSFYIKDSIGAAFIAAPLFGIIIWFFGWLFSGGGSDDSAWAWGNHGMTIFIVISVVLFPLFAYGYFWQRKRWTTCPHCQKSFVLEEQGYETLSSKFHFSKNGNSKITGKREYFLLCTECGKDCKKIKRYSEKA